MTLRVLYIEDDENNRDMLALRMEMEGVELLLAEDGTSGLAKAGAERPDVVLVDIGLPDIDGLELTRRLRAKPETAGLPVIALTAHASAADRERALAAGCDDFDTKPVDIKRLMPKIRRLAAGQEPLP